MVSLHALLSLGFLGLSIANTEWTVCDRKLLKDNSLFFIRGVNYQPTPIGRWSGDDLLLQPALWQRDLALLRNMNINAAKVYAFAPGNPSAHKVYLDAAFNNGYLPIYTMFSIWVAPYPMSSNIDISSSYFQSFVAQYRLMAQEVACHPGTMGFVIGGEMNGVSEVYDQSFWNKFNALSGAVRAGINAANCGAKKILTTNFLDDYAESINQGELHGADVDVWGVNIYDKRFDTTKMNKFAQVTKKPILFSEYGVPFGGSYSDPSERTPWAVGQYLLSMAQTLRNSFLGQDPSGKSLLVGGFVFEYTDEWWKEGFPTTQEGGYNATSLFPLGYFSEEYFGLFSISPGANGLNVLTPRQVIAQLAALWALPVDGQPTSVNRQGAYCSLTVLSTMPSTPGPRAVSNCGIDIARGIKSFRDEICATSGGALGCQGTGYCRYCLLTTTQQSAPYPGCPASPPATTVSPTCANSSQICPNGVALLPSQSCQFSACPITTCDADPTMLARGAGMVYDSACLINGGLVGCDLLRPGCRYCNPPNKRTAFAPCPVVPSTSVCVTTLSDLNMGISVMEDNSCYGGGVGCDATRPSCRFCQMRSTVQSKLLPLCPGVSSSTGSSYASQDGVNADNNEGPSTSIDIVALAAVVGVMLLGFVVSKSVFLRIKESQKKDVALRTPMDPSIL
ncbi:unnamed protein product [Aphanomyces euteiches]|uniref:Uncharacterized protein n=1 Tax=Aphanomyces euteiches TaxID=100861 RepID=A0A6G0XXH6_9STRA|nr:hypothetical protein Ae201684_000457 [Aphanomyces euteiches]